MTRCRRCGDPTQRHRVDQTHCERCQREVAALLRADAARRLRRVFPFAKELSA